MRWFGYATHQEAGGFLSFVRSPFAPEARFPRFHASVCPRDGGLQVNLHIDQEDNQGHGNHQFVWAYRNDMVFEESQRLQSLLDKARQQVVIPLSLSSPKKNLNKKNNHPGKIISFLSKQKILCRFF